MIKKVLGFLFAWFALTSLAFAGWGNGGFVDTVDPNGIGGTSSEGVNVAQGNSTTADESILDVVKTFINYALGLLALIALGVLLYGGFQMVTAAGDDGRYKAGFTILKQAAIGLAFIALAWIVVRFIFFVIGFVVQ